MKRDLGRFSRGSSRFPLPQISYNQFSTLNSFISFSSVPVMKRQVWLAGILAIHKPWMKGLHHFSSLDQALCQTQVEDIFVTPCGFRGGRNRVWIGFSWGFSSFNPTNFILSSLHNYLIHFVSFHFIRTFDGASGIVDQHPCFAKTFITSQPSTRPCVVHELMFN